ncbi:MAG: hypothetical protein PVJ98_07880 [Akkermansiaceae bacterium]|jgi:hypothetical protein
MSQWRRFPKPAEPNENKGGFRKIKKGEGQATVFGGGGKAGLEMNTVGWILLTVSSFVPVMALLVSFTSLAWAFPVMMAAFLFAHAYLFMTAWMMHRKVPGKLLSLALCWGPLLILGLIKWLSSYLQG